MNRWCSLTLFLIISGISCGVAQSVQFIDTVYHTGDSRPVKSIINYKVIDRDTLKDGPALFYYANGTLWQQGFYKMDKIDGHWIIYHANGKPETEIDYKDGIREGRPIRRQRAAGKRARAVRHRHPSS